MRVGIGVLAYNRPGSIERCLDSLFENLNVRVPVAVHFDLWNSEMDTLAAKYPVTGITGTQRGISYANNRLLSHFQSCDLVFLVQDDVRFLRPEWLERYCNAIKVVPYLAFFDPYYQQDRNRPRHYHVNYLERRQLVVRDGIRLWLCHKSPQGAFQAIGRACLEQTGYFDTGFGRYGCEHNDFWLRTCNAGIAPQDHFYDIEQSTELLKIDWGQPTSLDSAELDQAFDESEDWRQKLFVAGTEGFHRIRVDDHRTDLQVLRSGPEPLAEGVIPVTRRHELMRECWTYPGRLPVLTYHAVADKPGDRFAVSPRLFKAHIELLANHFMFVTIAHAAAIWRQCRRFPPDLALLTFDDGYRDILSIAPMLEALSIPATFFVPTAWVGQSNDWDRRAFTTRQHLSWGELRELIRMGHEIASHSCEHIRLTRLSRLEAIREMADSKAELQDRLGQQVHAIAYPFGSMNQDLAAVVAQHYEVGFTTMSGAFDWDENRHMIRRIVVDSTEDPRGLLTRVNDYMMQASLSCPVAWTSWPRSAPRTRRPASSSF
jgi:peptidoglycan/xylan/chitin deacetylase (PgdA/CDA1 family)